MAAWRWTNVSRRGLAGGVLDRTRHRVVEHGLIEGTFAVGGDAADRAIAGDVADGAHHVEQAVDADDQGDALDRQADLTRERQPRPRRQRKWW